MLTQYSSAALSDLEHTLNNIDLLQQEENIKDKIQTIILTLRTLNGIDRHQDHVYQMVDE